MLRVRLHHPLIGGLILCLSLFLALPAFAQDQQTYVVQPGENLFRIALNFGVDVTMLAQANGITNAAQIYAGQTLVIPSGASFPLPQNPAAPAPVVNTAPADNPTYYTVQPGEHLVNIAEKFGLSADQLIQLNSLTNPNLIFSGQQLIVSPNGAPASIPAAVSAAPAGTSSGPQTYTVQPGDRLASIASQFNVSWPDIATANNLTDPNIVYVGQTLVIPAPGTSNIADYGIVSNSNVAAAPAAVVAFGKSIVVDLSDQTAYAYEDGRLVHSTLGSTGLPGSPTVLGDYNIYVKYDATLMVGPGYYLPDVPWTMYFYEGYGIHGTYWHHNWGHPMSHGCVNLPTEEAKWFYDWAPVGTPVHVQL
jgi:LysM repeat protein